MNGSCPICGIYAKPQAKLSSLCAGRNFVNRYDGSFWKELLGRGAKRNKKQNLKELEF